MLVYVYMGTHRAVYVYMGFPCICANSCLPLLMYVSMTGSVDYLHMLTTSKVNKDRRAK